MTMTAETLEISLQSGIARISLNRPKRLNALTGKMMQELGDVLAMLADDNDVRVVSLTGAGRAFCAGQDLGERDPRKLNGPLDLAAIQRDLFHPVVRAITGMSKPVVACVNGVAAGAGAGIALAADIVLAAENAAFVFSFAKVGLSVDAGLGRTLVQSLGAAQARGLLMTGGTLTGKDAANAGLIWKAVDINNLDRGHTEILEQLSAAPRKSLAGIKHAIAAAQMPEADYLEREAQLQGQAGADPDYSEGVLAFLEGRTPKFS